MMTKVAKATPTIHYIVQAGVRTVGDDGNPVSTRTAEALVCGADINPAQYGDNGTEVLTPATRITSVREHVTCKKCLSEGGA